MWNYNATVYSSAENLTQTGRLNGKRSDVVWKWQKFRGLTPWGSTGSIIGGIKDGSWGHSPLAWVGRRMMLSEVGQLKGLGNHVAGPLS